MRVLFLDDEKERHHHFREHVARDAGMVVTHVWSMAEFGRALHEPRFELIMLDHDLEDGVHAARMLVALPPIKHPDLVIIHSHDIAGGKIIRTLLHQGGIRSLCKPYFVDKLDPPLSPTDDVHRSRKATDRAIVRQARGGAHSRVDGRTRSHPQKDHRASQEAVPGAGREERNVRDPKDCKAVMPSDECCACRTYVCTRCERRRPWGDGASDDTPALCDDCAMAVRSGGLAG